jgi:hypothetical protein
VWSNSIARDDEKDVFGWMDGKKARKKWSKEQRSEGGGGKGGGGRRRGWGGGIKKE